MDIFKNSFLTPFQQIVLSKIHNYLSKFYLTGGTALSEFYLKHRYSVDLDFFTQDNIAFNNIFNAISDFSKNNNLNIEIITDTNYFKHINVISEEYGILTLHFSYDLTY